MKSLETPLHRYEGPNRAILQDGIYQIESVPEFLIRMKECRDMGWIDLERAEQLLPVFDNCKKDRRDLRAALEGIAAGGKMLVVTAKAGFPSWGHFESCALGRCKTARMFYNLAVEERRIRRLDDAETALQHRAVDGVDEPIINHLGNIVGYKKKYSDQLLALNLKALDPNTYADRQRHEVHGLVVSVNMDMGLPPAEQEAQDIVEFSGLGDVDLSGLQADALP